MLHLTSLLRGCRGLRWRGAWLIRLHILPWGYEGNIGQMRDLPADRSSNVDVGMIKQQTSRAVQFDA